MIKVKFLVDYRGVLTGETFYPAGTVADFEDKTAAALVDGGRAERVKAPAPAPAPDAAGKGKGKRKG